MLRTCAVKSIASGQRSFSRCSAARTGPPSPRTQHGPPSTGQRHTPHQHGIEGRITYPFHPRCGETVVTLKRFAFRGVEVVAIPHPDGAIVWVPAWMMDASAAHYKVRKEPRFSIDILRSLRTEVDALLRFLHPTQRRRKTKMK